MANKKKNKVYDPVLAAKKRKMNEYFAKIRANLKSMRRRVHNGEVDFKLINNFNQTINTMLLYSDLFNETNKIKNNYFHEKEAIDEIKSIKISIEKIKKIINARKIESYDENQLDPQSGKPIKVVNFDLNNDQLNILRDECKFISTELNYMDRRYKKINFLNKIEFMYLNNKEILDNPDNYKERVLFMIDVFKRLQKEKLREYKKFYKSYKKNIYWNRNLGMTDRTYKNIKYCANFNNNIMENRIFLLDSRLLQVMFDHFERHMKIRF